MPNVGDRIVGQWEPDWFYPGVVVGDNGGSLTVQFDDGDRRTMGPDQVKTLAITVGSRVHGRWQGGKSYFPGRVSAVTGYAISIDYDDGDKETSSVSLIRQHVSDL